MNVITYSIVILLTPFLATTVGSALVYLFRKKISNRLNQLFNGFAAGVMLAAAIFGLIIPSMESEVTYMPPILVAVIGFLLGIGLLLLIDKLVPHMHAQTKLEEGVKTAKLSRANKMFLAVTIHNIPEGLSVGVALGVALANFNADPNLELFTAISGALMISIGIAIQNVPEGAAIALPLKETTNSSHKAFLYGTFSGLVEPLSALIGVFLAYYISYLMPWALSFAGGCMIYVIIDDLIPSASSNDGDKNSHVGLLSFVIGFVIMMILEATLG